MGIKKYIKRRDYADSYILNLLKVLPNEFIINMYEVRAVAKKCLDEEGKITWYESHAEGHGRVLISIDGGKNAETTNPSYQIKRDVEGPFREPSKDVEPE